MQEDTRLEPDKPDEILVVDSVRAWENVRLRGEDIQAGTTLVRGGETLKPGHLCLLAAAGVASVSVARRPVVGIIATGSELKDPGTRLLPGQIYESNRVGLAALLKLAGATPVIYPVVPDVLQATEQALGLAFSECDLVLSAGGASVGELDLVKPAFSKLGGELHFWKIAIRPGRPFLFGAWNRKFLFGLPGNPVSAVVTLLLLVWPAVRRWQGALEVELPAVRGILQEPLVNRGDRRHFMRVVWESTGVVRPAGAQQSHVLGSLAAARGLVDVPPQTTVVAGTSVIVRVWEV
jgi:molybdopterin molybdotransferase